MCVHTYVHGYIYLAGPDLLVHSCCVYMYVRMYLMFSIIIIIIANGTMCMRFRILYYKYSSAL